MELNSVERIVFGFDSGQKFIVEWGSGGADDIPEVFEVAVAAIEISGNSIVMVEIENSLSFRDFVSEVDWNVSEKVGGWGGEWDSVDDCDFSADWGDCALIEARGEVGQKLHSEASAPNWESSVVFVLVDCIVENQVGVGSPFVVDVDWFPSSWE